MFPGPRICARGRQAPNMMFHPPRPSGLAETAGGQCHAHSCLLPLLQREKKGPVAARNGEMRAKRNLMPCGALRLPHLPQLRWGPFLSRGAGEDKGSRVQRALRFSVTR